jgi:hypothetical protein
VPKTTIDLPESLLSEAKEVAAREGTTLRALVVMGLRSVVDRRRHGRDARFRLRDASVDGRGLQPAFRGVGWDRIREAAYDDGDA